MEQPVYICPVCNVIVDRPRGSDRHPACELGHPLKDRLGGLVFKTGKSSSSFALGFLSCGVFLITMGWLVSINVVTINPEWKVVLACVLLGLLCGTAVFHGFLTAARLRKVGDPANRLANKFSAYGWGVILAIIISTGGALIQMAAK